MKDRSTPTTIGRKPQGFLGRLAGRAMNLMHSGQYKNIIQKYVMRFFQTGNELSILDIGCGGGNAVLLFNRLFSRGCVFGMDHSPDMVKLAKRLNRGGILKGSVCIDCGDVCKMQYEDDQFDIIAAFDTVNFWSNVSAAFNEIRRVLKQGGGVFVINGYPKEGTKWWNFVKFKNENDYRAALTAHGFSSVEVFFENNTIIVYAMK